MTDNVDVLDQYLDLLTEAVAPIESALSRGSSKVNLANNGLKHPVPHSSLSKSTPRSEEDSSAARVPSPSIRNTIAIPNIQGADGNESEPQQALSPWLEYLVKKRDNRERLTSKSESGSPIAPMERPQIELDHAMDLDTFLQSHTEKVSSRRSTFTGANLDRRTVSSMDCISSKPKKEKYLGTEVRDQLSRLDTPIVAVSESAVDKAGQHFGWTIKASELIHDESGLGKTEYKTILIPPDATVLETLTLILKKWRYIDPRFAPEFKQPKLVLSDGLQQFVLGEKWKLYLMDGSKIRKGPLEMNERLNTLVDRANEVIQFGFRREDGRLPSELSTNYKASVFFQPSYVYKLSSQYKMDASSTDVQAIESSNWSWLYISFVKNRFLCFFHSPEHARWSENVIHEIDFSRVMSINPGEQIQIVDKGNTICDNSILIRTRTRTIVLCCRKDDHVRILQQLEDVRRWLLQRQPAQPNPVSVSTDSISTTTKSNNLLVQKSSGTHLVHAESKFSVSSALDTPLLSPTQLLIGRLEQTRRLNDIDHPPLDLTDPSKWNISVNANLRRLLKEWASTKLAKLMESNGASSMADIAGLLRDPSLIEPQTKTRNSFSAADNSGMVSKMKGFLRGFSGEKGSGNTSPTTTSTITSMPASNLFGVPLEELSTRLDNQTNGVPLLPAIVTKCISIIREKGIHASGIFRIAGSVKRIESLKRAFEKPWEISSVGAGSVSALASNVTSPIASADRLSEVTHDEIDFSLYNVHDVAGVFKMFLRDLPEPLLCSKLYRTFIQTEKFRHTPKTQVFALRYLIMLLPPVHRLLLERILQFLKEIADNSEDRAPHPKEKVDPGLIDPETGLIKGNLMTASNLAVVIGPNILREKQASNDDNRASVYSSKTSRHASIHFVGDNVVSKESLLSPAEELSDSASVVNIMKLMIEHWTELFEIPDAFLDELSNTNGSPQEFMNPPDSAQQKRATWEASKSVSQRKLH